MNEEKSKTEDEKIDGPKIVAGILNHMDSPQKTRLVKAIQQKRPDLAVKIEGSLFRFDDVAELSPKGIQILTQNIEHRDLVLSLKTASATVKSAIFSNLSQRKTAMIQDDLEALPPVRLSDIEAAQRRILETLDNLRRTGKITTQGTQDIWV